MRQSLKMHRYLADLIDLDLPNGDWALFGSGPLLMRGWIDDVGDLDIISRLRAWDKAQILGTPVVLDDGEVIYQIGEGITVGSSWAYGEFSIDHLIETAETIEGIPCVRLEHVISFKEIADRPKDRRHLALIGEMRE